MLMLKGQLSKVYILMVFFFLFSAFSSPFLNKTKKFDLTTEEHAWLEKFFRYFMLRERAIYTLAGSKPFTEMSLFYSDVTEEQLREEERENRLYFLLNRNNKKDMEFYSKLSSLEKEEKAYLIEEKDFIYNIEDLWDKWEKIRHRFPLKKKFLLIKKERHPDLWKEIWPKCRAVYDIVFVDVLRTALVIQENYELFRQAVGYDFDPMAVVFELEDENSNFWSKLDGKEGWKYSYLWGVLYGFGKENSFSYFWKGRQMKGLCSNEKEKLFATNLKSRRSCQDAPSFSDRSAFSISSFSIPAFASFSENDPVVAKYEDERKKIKQLYKGKDFVAVTLELLTDQPE